MRLFLDPATRAFRAVAPDGALTLPPQLFGGLLQMNVADSAWTGTYLPAWQVAHAAGLDLVVNGDGTTQQVPHALTPEEQAVTARQAAFRALASNPAPDTAAVATALRSLIHHLKLDA